MPDDTTDGQQLDNKSAGTAVLEQPGGESAQTEGTGDATDQTEGADTGLDGAADAGTDAKNADPDADIKAMLRENRTAKQPLQGKDAQQEAGEGAKDGKPAGDPKAQDKNTDKAEASPFAQQLDAAVAAMDKAFGDEFAEEHAKALKAGMAPVFDLVKQQQEIIEKLQESSKGYGEHAQAAQARTFHSELDRLAGNGFKFLGTTGDDSADMDVRAEIWADAGVIFNAAKQRAQQNPEKYKPMSEARAVLAAVRMHPKAGGDKSDDIKAEQEQAKKRQAMRSVAPKSGGGGPVKNPSVDHSDPDADAHAAVDATLRSFGRR